MLKSKILAALVIFCLACVNCALCQEQIKYDAGSRRDPFIPLVTPDGRLLNLDAEREEKSSLLLEGIIYDKFGISYAVVNGMVVKIGDKISDYQVLKIDANKAVFIKDGETQEIILKKEEEE
ncbi:MAG: hypothetical protein FJZ08_00360 [Candidatus Omnitrophica bacterium]|nr:hypothetical protein [Candidatus Omnitrophota bacterium]